MGKRSMFRRKITMKKKKGCIGGCDETPKIIRFEDSPIAGFPLRGGHAVNRRRGLGI